MKTFTLRTQGLDKVLRNAEKWAKDKTDKVDRELDTAVQNIAADARSRSAGSVSGNISADTSQKFRKSVGVNNKIGAYVEFGTGSKVFQGPYNFTGEERRFARLFYVSGKGKTPSKPYLFPSFHAEIPKLIGRIKKVIFGR